MSLSLRYYRADIYPLMQERPMTDPNNPANRDRQSAEAVWSVFVPSELAFLGRGRSAGGQGSLARIATVGKDGTPHVVPVGMWTHNTVEDTIDVRGRDLEKTKKFRDVARSGRAAIVIDDMLKLDPSEQQGGWDSRPRAVEVRGRAEVVAHPEPLIRIHPERIVSWGTDPDHPSERNARTVS
jgi:pyridoxamine 5'-phosphate oxidase family protein